MIGNDIVDLNLAKTQSNWERKGFLEKQFTDVEQFSILNSKDSFLQVWLLWSMKEAAYKCYSQQYQVRFFNPKKLQCEIISATKGIVKINQETYFTTSQITQDYIYTIASNKITKFKHQNIIQFREPKNASEILKKQLKNNFNKEVKIVKIKIGVPELVLHNEVLPHSISLTHHGNFGAYIIS